MFNFDEFISKSRAITEMMAKYAFILIMPIKSFVNISREKCNVNWESKPGLLSL